MPTRRNIPLPLVDLSKCGLLVEDDSKVGSENFASIGKQLYNALSTSGFAYLSNHGIPKEKVDDVNKIAEKFYDLPDEEKKKYHTHDLKFSYDPMGSIMADMKHHDYQEAFRITGEAFDRDNVTWPEIPGFLDTCFDMAESCKLLLWRILKALGAGMKLQDSEYFYKTHSLMNRRGNTTTFKMNHFPPVPTDEVLSDNRARLGEHTDWTSIILLFQDDIGGLQKKDENGIFIDVTPIPGTIVLIVGDMMQKWSGGRLKATVHRVIPPNDPEKRKRIRRSIVYFGIPNQDVMLEPLQFNDGVRNEEKSDEKPLTVEQYMAKRFEEVFK